MIKNYHVFCFTVLVFISTQLCALTQTQVDRLRVEATEISKKLEPILISYKHDELYKDVLAEVNPYFFIERKNCSYQKIIKKLTQSLDTVIPFMMKLIEHNHMYAHIKVFESYIQFVEKVQSDMTLSSLQNASLRLISKYLQSEQLVKSCSRVVASHSEKNETIRVELRKSKTAEEVLRLEQVISESLKVLDSI